MKKFLAVIGMLILVLAVTAGGVLASSVLQKHEEEGNGTGGGSLENPASPDSEYLEMLGLEPFVSELPVLMVDTDGQQIQKENTIWVNVAVLDQEGGNDIYGAPDQVLTATIKYRGASSYAGFDKPQYRLKFYNGVNEGALDYDLFGLGADSEWVLNGPYLDRSLLRNYLMYKLSGEIMEWAPDCTFFELFVDGKYQGVYLAIEPVTDGASRLRLSQFGLLSGATSYIVKWDRVGTETNVLHTYGETAGYTSQELSVSYPGIRSLTTRQYEWIEQDISQFEEVLYSDSFADPNVGYEAYIDVDSFVNYFIINEFSMNQDAGNLSTFIYKELGGKMQLCVWDFNNSFDNYQWFALDTNEFFLVENNWFSRLLQDSSFVDRVVEQYRQLRQGSLSDEHIKEVLTQGREQLGEAVDRNFALWGYTFGTSMLIDGEDDISRDPENYEQALEMLENTIQERLAFLDASIEELYQYCIAE